MRKMREYKNLEGKEKISGIDKFEEPSLPVKRVCFNCCLCGKKIIEGEEYYDIDGSGVCENCISHFKFEAVF